MKRLALLLVVVMLPVLSYAAVTFVCPNTYQTVFTNFTMDQVRAACGEPTSQSSTVIEESEPLDLVEWVYTNPSTRGRYQGQFSPTLQIIFKNNQVDQIITSNRTASNLFFCFQAKRITVGDTMAQVRGRCGVPTYINSMLKSQTGQVQVMQWTYNFGRYRPQMIFIFEEDRLQEIKTGPVSR